MVPCIRLLAHNANARVDAAYNYNHQRRDKDENALYAAGGLVHAVYNQDTEDIGTLENA